MDTSERNHGGVDAFHSVDPITSREELPPPPPYSPDPVVATSRTPLLPHYDPEVLRQYQTFQRQQLTGRPSTPEQSAQEEADAQGLSCVSPTILALSIGSALVLILLALGIILDPSSLRWTTVFTKAIGIRSEHR